MYSIVRNTIYLIEVIIFNLFFIKSRRQLRKLKDSHRGETILLVANGPSLNKVQLDKLRHMTSIGMNKISLIYNRTTWRPDYIVTGNPLVVSQSWKSFKNGVDATYFLSIKSIMTGKVVPNAIYFLQSRRQFVSNDFSKYVGSGGTVTFSVLQLAAYLGAAKIVIIGLDHSYSKETRTLGKRVTETFKGEDINHFDPNYFKDQKWDLPNLDLNESSYRLFREESIKLGIEVIDCTIDGKLHVFPKKPIEEYYL